MVRSLLRASLLLSGLGAALSAGAAVSYSFVGADFLARPQSFSFMTSTYILADTTVSTFDASSNVSSARFALTGQSSNLQVTSGNATGYFYFPSGAFSKNGVNSDGSGTLTVSGAPGPVPEPSALAALGLGAVAMLRRRKRA